MNFIKQFLPLFLPLIVLSCLFMILMMIRKKSQRTVPPPQPNEPHEPIQQEAVQLRKRIGKKKALKLEQKEAKRKYREAMFVKREEEAWEKDQAYESIAKDRAKQYQRELSEYQKQRQNQREFEEWKREMERERLEFISNQLERQLELGRVDCDLFEQEFGINPRESIDARDLDGYYNGNVFIRVTREELVQLAEKLKTMKRFTLKDVSI